MPKSIATHAVATALGSFFGLLIFLHPAAGAATVPSRAPQCMTVEDSYIINFLAKIPAWLFTNHCSYAESYYAEYPGTTVWVPSVKFNAYESLAFMSNGKAAKLTHILECPSGSTATGTNPNLCTK